MNGTGDFTPGHLVMFNQEVQAMWSTPHGDGTSTVALFSMDGDRYFEGDVHLPTENAWPGKRFRVVVAVVE